MGLMLIINSILSDYLSEKRVLLCLSQRLFSAIIHEKSHWEMSRGTRATLTTGCPTKMSNVTNNFTTSNPLKIACQETGEA